VEPRIQRIVDEVYERMEPVTDTAGLRDVAKWLKGRHGITPQELVVQANAEEDDLRELLYLAEFTQKKGR